MHSVLLGGKRWRHASENEKNHTFFLIKQRETDVPGVGEVSLTSELLTELALGLSGEGECQRQDERDATVDENPMTTTSPNHHADLGRRPARSLAWTKGRERKK